VVHKKADSRRAQRKRGKQAENIENRQSLPAFGVIVHGLIAFGLL
jgi:hypothetical protein